VVLVDLWATWCKPCLVSMPFYKALFEQHQKEGFEVVAISVDLHKEDVEAFVAKEELPFRVLHDPEGRTPEQVGLSTMPTMVLLGRDGAIAYLHRGFEESDKEQIAGEVERALKVVTSSAAPGDTPR
jgi:peroxiredoxin